MAAITKNRNFFKWPKPALFYARKCPNLNCISIMMSFLTYITGFFTILKGDHPRIISAEFG
jgi:hypothetical protein